MTVTPTYPGVYIQEIPSGSRTITGVATSITAFLGRASRGPVDEPVPIAGFGDFERTFGGLWRESGLGYAVRDFYLNGGGEALVVRVVHTPDADADTADAGAATASLGVDGLTLEASGPGAWANVLEAEVTHPAGGDAADIAAAQGVTAGDLFNVVVREGPGDEAPSESYLNVTTVDGPRRVDLALAGSALVRVAGTLPAARPHDGLYAVLGLDVGGLHLVATDVTRWARGIQAVVTHPPDDGSDAAATAAAAAQGVDVADLFTLVLDAAGTVETYAFVTVIPEGNRIDTRLAADSALARAGRLPAARPPAGTYALGAAFDVGGLQLVPSDLAAWAGSLRAQVTHPTGADADAAATEQGVEVDDLFDLTLTAGRSTERHRFLTVVAGPRRVDSALSTSALVRAALPLPNDRPALAARDVDTPATGVDGDAPTAPDYLGSEDAKTGIHALLRADLFNLLCIPPPTPATDLPDPVWADAAAFCTARRAFLIVDPPESETAATVPAWVTGDGGLTGSTMRNAAVYFPRIRRPDPLRGGATATFAACGAVAGTFARTDGSRGVWKAPAGTEAGLSGIVGLSTSLTDAENGRLNPLGINCLRTFRGIGSVVWGARTLRGSDRLADEYKYVPVRRLALFLEETLYRNTQWVVFEPNDEQLWALIRASIGAFMQSLFRRGAFQGTSPRDAYFVRCDKDTTTQYDIDRGVVNIVVGFAPLKPAEFVVIGIQQKTASAAA
jgi:phage tail sheath protein FI/prolyl-tRNA editing enzyme YbaK/EbsC (Cys-tRNA(Pro) deacylase)